jgi:outer membrane protein TolC
MFRTTGITMHHIKSVRTVAIIGLALMSLLRMATAQTAQIDLYVREGLKNNLGLQQDYLTLEKVKQDKRQALGLFLPNVTATAQASEMRGNLLDIGKLVNPAYATLNQLTGSSMFPTNLDLTLPLKRQTTVQVLQPIIQPAVYFNHALQSHLVDAQEWGYKAAARSLVAEIKIAYFNVAKATRVAELYLGTIPLLQENLRVNESLVKNEKRTAESVYRAQAELSEIIQKADDAERQRTGARNYFNFLLHRDLESSVNIDSVLDDLPTVADSLSLVVPHQTREELLQISEGIEAADRAVSLATSSYFPTLGAGFTLGYQGQTFDYSHGKDFEVLTLQAQWNIFNGFQDAAKREQAQIERRKLELKEMEVQEQISMQVRLAALDVQVGRSALRTAGERYLSASQGYKLIEKKYALGAASQVEYLDARTALTNAGLNSIITRYDFFSRLAALERARGSYPLHTVIPQE